MNETTETNKITYTEEKEITKTNGMTMLLLSLLGILGSIALIVTGAATARKIDTPVITGLLIASGILLLITFLIVLDGLKVIHPNEAAIYTLFGKYYGTIKKAGFYHINPFATCYNPSASALFSQMAEIFTDTSKSNTTNSTTAKSTVMNKKISTKTSTLNNRKQKVNDALGNPIIIGAAVIWKVTNPTKAILNIDNYSEYLSTQCDAIIRNNARLYPYDVVDDDTDEKTLRGSSIEIAAKMKEELQDRVDEAGIEIKEVRITDLAYSDEIAAAMLQKQQATAVIAARQKIVEGAVSMVKMAIEQLSEEEIVVLDDERKAAMVSNLLVVLCGNKEAQPVVNSSSIY